MKKNTLTILAAIFMATTLFAQTVTTFTEGTPDDAIALDSNGNIYCSNYVGDTVFKFTPTGEVSSFITGLNTPNGLAFNSNDELYVCDGQGNTIYKYDTGGNLLETIPASSHPSGIIKSLTSDTMIFTEYSGDKINYLEPDGTITEISSAPELNGPVGLTYGDNGDLYVGNYTDRKIFRVLNDGSLEYIAQLPASGSNPNLGFISFAQGAIFGTIMGEHKIYAVNPNEVDSYVLFAGSDAGDNDGDINQATFHTPNGILFNNSGDTMYITDFGTKNLRIMSNVVLAVNDITIENDSFKIYPNPTKDTLFVSAQLPREGDYLLRIFDVSGKEVFKNKGISNDTKIATSVDVRSWRNGTYLVEITFENSTITKKMIK